MWLFPEHKITPDKIDDIVCAEIPDPVLDPQLHQIVTSNMVHGPCGGFNPASPCMEHGQCSKKYPKPFISETQLGTDSFPLYRRRRPEDGGQVSTITVNVMGNWTTQEIDNRWVVRTLQQVFVTCLKLPLQCRAVYVHHLHQVCIEVCTQRL